MIFQSKPWKREGEERLIRYCPFLVRVFPSLPGSVLQIISISKSFSSTCHSQPLWGDKSYPFNPNHSWFTRWGRQAHKGRLAGKVAVGFDFVGWCWFSLYFFFFLLFFFLPSPLLFQISSTSHTGIVFWRPHVCQQSCSAWVIWPQPGFKGLKGQETHISACISYPFHLDSVLDHFCFLRKKKNVVTKHPVSHREPELFQSTCYLGKSALLFGEICTAIIRFISPEVLL